MNISVFEEISSRFKWKLIKCKKKTLFIHRAAIRKGKQSRFFFFNYNALFILTNIYGHYLI